MALMLLRVFLVGVLAAAADDVPITWWSSNHAVLPCVAPLAERLTPRRAPLPLDSEDKPKPRVEWRKGEEVITKKISPSGALEVSKRGRGEGVYQCMVRHHGGFVLGYPTHLKFASMDSQFSEHPANVSVRSGQPFVISCSISSAPPAIVSWLKDELPLPNNERYHVIQNQLLITDVSTADEGYFRCKATNPHINKTRISHAGFLSVDPAHQQEDPVFLPLHHETSIMAARGSRVVLPCPVSMWPRNKLVWKLTPPGEKTSELDVVDEVFVIRSLQLDQEGNYSCSVEGNSQLVKTFKVTLTEPARITIPPASRETRRASTVRFNCTATGRPAPVVTWFKDGKPLQIAGGINLRKSTDGQRTELVISGVTSNDAGIYQCFAQNVAATDSHWAILNVTGANAAAPTNVQCWPVGDNKIKLTWEKPVEGDVVAYTVHGQPEEEKKGNSLPGQPLTTTEGNFSVAPLIPYLFQVRAYLSSKTSTASDMSTPVVCQGQGAPLKITKLKEDQADQVVVSWEQFARRNPGVVEWILQTKEEGSKEEWNVTLDGSVHNHTLYASSSYPLLVRVLGSRDHDWIQQNLTLVPWTSTSVADNLDAGELTAIPDKLKVTELSPRQFTIVWECEDVDSRYTFLVCVRSDDMDEICMERQEMSATFEELSPGTLYKVVVQARLPNQELGGPYSRPLTVVTPSESPQRFRELSAHFVNSSHILVSWNGAPEHYKVHYSAELKLPVEQWDSVETHKNSVFVPVIDPNGKTYLMVTGYNPKEHSRILTISPYASEVGPLRFKDISAHYINSSKILVSWNGIPAHYKVHYSAELNLPIEQWNSVETDKNFVLIPVINPSEYAYIKVTGYNPTEDSRIVTITPFTVEADYPEYEVTRSGVRVWWKGNQPRVVQYAQNITTPLEQWTTVTVKGSSIELPVDLSLPTFVMVTPNDKKTASKILTIDPRPAENSSLYLGLGISLGVLFLALMAVAAVCLWRKRKRGHSPVRSRRRNAATNDENVEESEMKVVSGASGRRLANGGARGPGEPLLNGHVHITENPTVKTPNGKMKKGRRYEAAFDVSRHEDPDATMETILADTSTASYNFLDTSRRPEFDVSRSSREMSANNSFTKLPDDNMNSEVTRSTFQLDNSKIQPTLQPNG